MSKTLAAECFALILAFVAATFAPRAMAQTLVKDINTQLAAVDGSSDPKFFAVSRNRAFFQATSKDHGAELWVTDGTSAGTRLLKDIRPGIYSSAPHSFLVSGTHHVYFVADDGVHGEELWVIKPDLSVELVKDIRPGPQGSSPTNFTLYQTRAMFSADDGTHGRELWSSDASAANTKLVTDIFSGSFSSDPGEMVVYRQWVYFGAHTLNNGRELWRSNGTTTQLWLEINPGSGGSDPKEFCLAHDRIYFQADDGRFGRELWSTSRFANDKKRHSDINPLGSSTPQEITELVGALYFRAYRPSLGYELYRYTRLGGTKLVRDLQPGTKSSDPRELTIFASHLFFAADDGTNGRELWRIGTTLERIDIFPGPSSSHPVGLTASNDALFYACRKPGDGRQRLWRTALAQSQFSTAQVDVATTLFGATDITPFANGILTASSGKTEGIEACFATQRSHTRIKNIFVGATESSSIQNAVDLDGLLIFSCRESVHGLELWRSDGTESGTYILADIAPGSADSNPIPFAVVGSYVLFTAGSPNSGRELWRSDGTTQGTQLVADINPGSGDGAAANVIEPVRRQPFALFAGTTLNHGTELWRSDGTSAGTYLLRDIRPGPGSSHPSATWIHNDMNLIFADDGLRGRELWSSRGSRQSTTLIQEFVSGSKGPWILSQVSGVAGERAILAIYPNSMPGPATAWSSDGTAQGTFSLNTRILVSECVSSGTRVFYWDSLLGGRCHVTDGTLAGTSALSAQMTYFLASPSLQAYGDGGALFVPTHPRRLWKTDGTSAGTSQFLSSPDLRLADAGQLAGVGNGGHAAFAAGAPAQAPTLFWTSDGTSAGTTQHLMSQTAHPNPKFLLTAGDKLFFVAHRVDVGRELWVMPLSAIGASNTISYGTGCAGKAGTPRISSSGVPRVGKLLDASVTNAMPNSVAIFALGVQRTRIPSSGCQILTLPILTLSAPTDARGTSTLRIPIPNEVSWLGRSIFTQAFVLEQGARWAGWFALSQGQQAVVGR